MNHETKNIRKSQDCWAGRIPYKKKSSSSLLAMVILCIWDANSMFLTQKIKTQKTDIAATHVSMFCCSHQTQNELHFLMILHFFSLNTDNVFYITCFIKYGFIWFVRHCILFYLHFTYHIFLLALYLFLLVPTSYDP